MKAFLLLFAVCLTTVCRAQSNDSTATINLKASTAQKLFIDAQQKAVLEDKIVKMNDDIGNLNNAISSLQMVIKSMDAKDTAMNNLVDNYKREVAILNSEKTDYENRVKSLEKEVRGAKTKSKLTAFAGILVMIGAGYLYVMK